MNAPHEPPRSAYIGGADIAAILGVSPYRTAVETYLRKRGEADEVSDAPILRRGRMLEKYVREMYEIETGRTTVAAPFLTGAEEWQGGHPDALTAQLDGRRIVEFKTANEFTRRDWGEAGTDDVPVYYTAQVQWYLALSGLRSADLAALIGIDDFRVYVIEADPEIHRVLFAKAAEFWRGVVEGRPPAVQEPADVPRLFPRHSPGAVVEANDVDLAAITELKGVRQQVKGLEAREAEIVASLQLRMADAESLTMDGIPLATWKTQERRTVDVKELRAAHPEIAEAFEKVGRSRVFRIK